jgi:peptide/nickel transport system ATP-binding protein/oligopeptide transport system ATP-binding protein
MTAPAPPALDGALPLVRAEGLSRSFTAGGGSWLRPRTLRAVREVTLSIPVGRTLGLVGESGCGKSTVGRLLLALLRPTAGRVWLGETELSALAPEPLRRLRRSMQLVFQDPYSSLNPRLRVGETVGEPLEVHRPELSAEERRLRVRAMLARVGLRPEHAARLPAEFSGGQRQRVAIARALVAEPRFLVADEPVSALDVSVQAQVVNLLTDLQRERQLTMLFISHDLKVVERVSDEVAVMYLGQVVERAPAAALYARPLHPYTDALLSAIPLARGRSSRPRVVLEGELPSPLSPPPGCAFHPRCALYLRLAAAEQARCRSDGTRLAPVEGAGGRESACHLAAKLG